MNELPNPSRIVMSASSDRAAHLQMIQTAISNYEWLTLAMRVGALMVMAGAGYMKLMGLGAALGGATGTAGVMALYIMLAGVMLMLFWWMDAHYHSIKWGYIKLHDQARVQEDADFDMNVAKVRGPNAQGKAMFSRPAVFFYPVLVATLATLSLIQV